MVRAVRGRHRRAAATVAALLCAGLGAPPAGAQTPALCLTILHNNDAESQLLDAGSGLEAYGGAAEFVSLVRRERQAAAGGCGELAPPEVPRAVVTLSSGDNFLAGPEFNVSLEKGPPYYDSMVVDAVGYDALAIGNHEFDFGPEVLAAFIGGIDPEVPFLSANLDLGPEPELQALADAGRIRSSVVLERAGHRIGVIGATTPELPYISSPRQVRVQQVAPAVGIEIDRLQAEGVDKIILISHLQSVAEDIELLQQLAGVDVTIAGGGDELLANHDTRLIEADDREVFGPYPILARDVIGRDVPVVTTAGGFKYLGRLEVLFDELGEVMAVTGDPVRVVRHDADDAVVADPAVEQRVTKPVEAALQSLAGRVIGTTEVPLDGRRASVRTKETNLGDLVADALLAEVRRSGPEFGIETADVAVQNGGGIRNDSVLDGELTELDTFDVLPFANFVTVVQGVAPDRLKLIMENAVSMVEEGGGRFAQIAGFEVVYDPARPALQLDPDGKVLRPGERVRAITLDDGTEVVRDGAVVEAAPGVDVATIDFLARGGDQYPFGGTKTFTPLGVSYQQALSRYIQDELGGTITSDRYPEGGSGRISVSEQERSPEQ